MDDATMYYRMRKTVLEMLRDREYNVSEEEIALSKADFDKHFTNPSELNSHYERFDNSSIIVIFDAPEKIEKNYFATIEKQMNDNHAERCILIVQKQISPLSQRYVDKKRAEGKIIEIFLQKEVLMNITQHELVPLHEPLSPEDKAALLEKYKITETQLPRILRTDPVSRYYGVSPGVVFKITRKSETAGEYVTYRLVV